MTRELKLALIVGFSVMLLVTVLISDHLSRGRKAQTQAKLPEQPPVVIAMEAPKDPEPYVSITQGSLGRMTETSSSLVGSSQPVNNTVDPTIAQEIARRTGAVINGDAMMPTQMNVTPLPLGQNNVPSLPTSDLGVPRTGMAMQTGLTAQPQTGLSPQGNQYNMPVEQSPDGASIVGTGFNALAPVVRDGEMRLDNTFQSTEPLLPTLVEPTRLQEPTTPQKAESKVETTPKAEDRWHTIAQGDSAYSIAKKYYGNGEAWKALAKYNKDRIGSNGAVRVGVRVRIPDASVLGIKSSKTQMADTKKSDSSKGETAKQIKAIEQSLVKQPAKSKEVAQAGYKVKSGDSLAKISQTQLGTTKRMQEIMKLNPSIKDADDIRVGQVLVMPTK